MIDYSNAPDQLVEEAYLLLQQLDDLYAHIDKPALPLVLKRFWLMQEQATPDLLDYPEEAPQHDGSEWFYDVLSENDYEQRTS